MLKDLIIIGGGPAGLTAGIYAARSGLKTGIISKDIGGTVNSILMLENWPGFNGSGAQLMKQFYQHLKEYNVDIIMEEVENIDKKNDLFVVKTSKNELNARALILATGTNRRKINITGEAELTGRGVSYCVTCDSFFFKNKIVGVIGGSDCATTSAIALSDIAEKVYVIYRGEKLKCEDINSIRLKKKKNVEIIYNAIPKEIIGKKEVESLIIEQNKNKIEIKLDGIFIEIGAVPLTKFAENLKLELDNEKYIIVDKNMRTSIKGVYAAGDVTNFPLKQVVVASSQGAIAAKTAYEELKE